ncbi:AI-2E family transporter [Geminicoccus roseus]|uniref:AI-2E family transporter n=1 Tax=Geminicoccus roseus TaxID=404900 RepID=UPI00146FA2F1|nr:AI-2E family transporter [Geminicoccus roseus]
MAFNSRTIPSLAAVPAGNTTQHTAVILTATVVVGAAIIAALYFGQDILIPVALAVLLSFALAPLALRLQRLGLPRVPAVLMVVLVAFVGLGGFGMLVGSQLVQLADNLPQYQGNVAAKIQSFQSAAPPPCCGNWAPSWSRLPRTCRPARR